jgi:hypothetical protein
VASPIHVELSPTSVPEQAEIESVQAAAKWLVGAAAAIFAALMTGVQLSALGRLGTEHVGRLVVAITASVLALAATAIILVQAVRVLVHPGWTLQRLAHLAGRGRWSNHWLKDQLGGLRGVLGVDQAEVRPAQLYREYVILRRALATYQAHGTVDVPADLDDPKSPKITYTETSKDDLLRRVEGFDEIANRLAAAANLLDTRRRFRQLRTVIWALGAIPILAVPVFVAATTTAADAPISTPLAVRVVFDDTPQVRAALADVKLPETCAGRQVTAVAVGGTLSQPVVVSDGPPECKINRVAIGPDLGVAYPVNPR